MNFMEWEDSLNIGDPGIDAQHQELVRIVNDFYKKIPECQSLEEERTLTGQFLEDLVRYAQVHFQAEETLLIRHRYPLFDEQRREHASFCEELRRLQADYAAGLYGLSFDVFRFARDWIVNHIKQSDQKYIPYLKK